MTEDVEQLALQLRRRAFEVLDGKESLTAFLETLWQLDAQKPELLDRVAKQMEEDNGRWSETSALPEVSIRRDKTGRVGLISFTSTESKSKAEERPCNPIVWCSNRINISV